jgi:hypothetical protein
MRHGRTTVHPLALVSTRLNHLPMQVVGPPLVPGTQPLSKVGPPAPSRLRRRLQLSGVLSMAVPL